MLPMKERKKENQKKKTTVLKCAGATQRCQADTAYIKAKDDDQ